MRLRDALHSPSTMDILYSCNDRGTGEERSTMKPLGRSARKFTPVDRSQQGAALSGHPNVVDRTANVVDRTADLVIGSRSSAPITAPQLAPTALETKAKMQLTLKGLNAKKTTAIYSGTLGSVRIGISAFPGKTAPATIDVEDVFAVKAAKEAKAKLTKEERAALPKPTEAEKIAKMQERLDRAKAKLAAAKSDI